MGFKNEAGCGSPTYTSENSPETCVVACRTGVAGPGKEVPTSSEKGCGCPQNEGGYGTRYSTKGRGGLSSGQSCSNNRPCWNGYDNTPDSSDCRCYVIDYDKAAVGNTQEQFLVNAEAKFINKEQCCLGQLSKVGSQSICAPGWCPKSISKDCDIIYEPICKANPKDPRCKPYCSTIRNGKPRAYDTSTFCYEWGRTYCSTGTNIATDPTCREAEKFYRGDRPAWSEAIASEFCAARKADSKFNGFCACINSNLPEASCVDTKCTNDTAYKTQFALDQSLKCGTICLAIFEKNKAGNNINYNGNNIQQQCGNYTETKGEKFVDTWYSCNAAAGRCEVTPQGEQGKFPNDNTCGGNCTAVDKEQPGFDTETLSWIGGGIILLIIIIIIFIVIWRSMSSD